MCCVLHGNGGKSTIFWDVLEMVRAWGVRDKSKSDRSDTGKVIGCAGSGCVCGKDRSSIWIGRKR